MKFIYLFLVMMAFNGCTQKDIAQQEIETVVKKYLEAMMYNQYSDEYYDFVDNIFHPDGNQLGNHFIYSTIREELNHVSLYNIVTSSKIEKIIESHEKVYVNQKIDSNEVSYFVKIKYKVVASQGVDGFEFLEIPIDVYEYIVLGLDPADGKYKIVDAVPEPGAQFIDIKYALEKIDIVARMIDELNVEDLRNKLLKVKK